jgi:hypothetical protein
MESFAGIQQSYIQCGHLLRIAIVALLVLVPIVGVLAGKLGILTGGRKRRIPPL